MKSLLPNARFLGLPSEEGGRDWQIKSRQIDEKLENLGMDLAEETVYLLFERGPGAALNEESQVLIARSVIGPKKEVPQPLKLVDWVQASVERKVLTSQEWAEVMQECYSEWEALQRQGKKLAASFIILAKRRLTPELKLTLEVLFHE